LQLANKRSGTAPYEQEGNTIEVKANENIGWSPTKAMKVLASSDQFKYEELPGDTLTVTAKFVGGETITQTINLSFDKEGKVIGEISQVPAS